ncbi:hypothetical protein [Flexivirga caeni]|uniref:hypothetical protein n=1 Tax=Flexivirga caeni TaxID=2294115 RepID=UPI00131558B8|nr:hypothetical protein [Flexivirga caeni]
MRKLIIGMVTASAVLTSGVVGTSTAHAATATTTTTCDGMASVRYLDAITNADRLVRA